MRTLPLGTVTIVGLGLIGGSFALGLKANPLCREVVDVSRIEATLAKGLELGVIDRAEDPKSATFATSALVAWSKALPGLFPAGSTTPGSKAKPEIWIDKDGFKAAGGKAFEAMTALRAAADEASFKAALCSATP